MSTLSLRDRYDQALGRLEGRRRLFVEHYLVRPNGAGAAVRAGYASGSARQTAHRLLTDADICEALRLGRELASAATGITAERVMQELARIAFADLRKAASWGAGTLALVESGELDDETAAAIAEIAESEKGVKIKLHPKLPALERLGRQLGLWKDGEEEKAAALGAIVDILEAARARVNGRGGSNE